MVEVLSDSTEAYDRGEKFEFYRDCESLQEYVLVSQRKPSVEVYRRSSDGWLLHAYGPGDTVDLSSLGVRFPVVDLYEGIDLGAEPL